MILTSQSDFSIQPRGGTCSIRYQDGPECTEAAEQHLCVGQIQDKDAVGTILAMGLFTCLKDARWGRGLVFSHPVTDDCGAAGTQAWYNTETGDNGCRPMLKTESPSTTSR